MRRIALAAAFTLITLFALAVGALWFRLEQAGCWDVPRHCRPEDFWHRPLIVAGFVFWVGYSALKRIVQFLGDGDHHRG